MDKIAKDNDAARAALQQQKQQRGTASGAASPLSDSSVARNFEYQDAKENDQLVGAGSDGDGRGIMDFIFRGNNNINHVNNNNSSIKRMPASKDMPEKGRFDDDNDNLNSAPNGQSGGPPSIVHLPQMPQTMKQTDVPPTERERVEMEVIKSLMESYFSIVQKNFIDMVPKTIMYFLVNHVRDSLQNELVSELYRDAEVGTLMQEADDIAERRQNCVEMKDLLSKALDIVNEVRDFNTFK